MCTASCRWLLLITHSGSPQDDAASKFGPRKYVPPEQIFQDKRFGPTLKKLFLLPMRASVPPSKLESHLFHLCNLSPAYVHSRVDVLSVDCSCARMAEAAIAPSAPDSVVWRSLRWIIHYSPWLSHQLRTQYEVQSSSFCFKHAGCVVSQATPFAERGSGHTATIELLLRQKLDVTNQICALHRLHPLSWSTITSQPA